MKKAKNRKPRDGMIWANLLNITRNFAADREAADWMPDIERVTARPWLRCDMKLMADVLRRMADAGLNMVVLELGDAVKYESHPEIAVKGALTTKRLRRELDNIRKLGLEPIPMLNFSTAHDVWLGPYAHMVSSDTYYAVCRDLIAETIDLFDKPGLFHIGMDEETEQHQHYYRHVVIRQYDLWWRDLYFLQNEVEKGGSRAWIWSDHVWRHPEEFFRKMPKDIMQSNWYYGTAFRKKSTYVKAYLDLEEHGYDQVPTGSNYVFPVNFRNTVRYCRKNIAPECLKGFLQTTWYEIHEPRRQLYLDCVDAVGTEIARWNRNK